jgi:predicted DNA-binding ribbon-helix-helix protein
MLVITQHGHAAQLGEFMQSSVIKRSMLPDGHKTSVSLEDDFWKALKEISGERHMTQSALIHEIDQERRRGNLSSAIRLFVLRFYRSRATANAGAQMHARRSPRAPAMHAR